MPKVSEFDNFGVEDLSKEEYDKRLTEVEPRCLCAGCPTFVEGDESKAFCYPTIGTSGVIHHEKGCKCSTCPVYAEYELSHTFYCTRCSQLCQAYKGDVGGGHE